MKLKELRKQLGLTQPQASSVLAIPFRTYCRYEDEERFEDTFKYKQFIALLSDYSKEIVLKVETIKEVVNEVCQKYNVSTCYLFGSYSKGRATGKSDVDLMIVSEVDGLEFYQLISDLEEKLMKKVDLLKLETAIQNIKLMNDILKEGVKIYG